MNTILKIVTEELILLNFKLNANKTIITNDIITNSLKKDKVSALNQNLIIQNNLQKTLFNIRMHSIQFPNSGSLLNLLTEVYNKQIKILKKRPKNSEQIISIIKLIGCAF